MQKAVLSEKTDAHVSTYLMSMATRICSGTVLIQHYLFRKVCGICIFSLFRPSVVFMDRNTSCCPMSNDPTVNI
jgi:hypothetical protein